MNKYQKAYERLRSKEYRYPDHESVYADIETLGELVKKEMPKKPTEICKGLGIIDIGYCPNCDSFVESGANEFRCPDCGQRLDWWPQ